MVDWYALITVCVVVVVLKCCRYKKICAYCRLGGIGALHETGWLIIQQPL